MAVDATVLALLMLLVSGHVMSFSIGRRSARSTDLAQALSILQRQRRRIVGDDYFGSERLLDTRPVNLDDVSDWLSGARDPSDPESLEDVWMSDRGNFRDFDQDEGLNYDLSPLTLERVLSSVGDESEPDEVQASRKELDNIFGDDTEESKAPSTQEAAVTPEKKKKEEMVDVRGDKKIVQKKSVSDPVVDDSSESSGVSLDTLTREEFSALMKAVEKLQKQAARLGGDVTDDAMSVEGGADAAAAAPVAVEVKETVVKDTPSGERVVEEVDEVVPAGEDELESVFAESEADAVPALVEETKEVRVDQEGGPDGTVTRTVETDLIPVLPQLDREEEEAEEARELEEAIVSDLENGIEEGERTAAAVEAVRRRLEQEVAEEEEEQEEEAEAEAEEEEEEEAAAARGMERLDPDQLAALENYWLVSNYLDKAAPRPQPPPMKRTAKRAALTSARALLDVGGDDDDVSDDVVGVVEDDVGADGEPDVLAELRAGSVPSVKAFVMRILELQSELDKLKTVTRLEDLENDELTDALNEATLAQSEGTVSDLEFESLQQAIRIEEALQEIKKGESGAPGESEDVIKRGEPWRRKRGRDLDLGDDTTALTSLPALPVSPASRGRGVSKSDIERLLGESYLLQQAEDEAGEEDDGEGEEEEEEDGIDSPRKVSSLFLRNADQCPAVRAYSSNCELADLYALPVDEEARALCNLHEMCYACGQSLSVSQGQCDLVYRAAASALCHGQDACVLESEIFLRTMKLKTRYVPHSQPACRSACTARFLGVL